MITKERYRVIGLMSGTSLDGLDIAFCSFWKKTGTWNFKIEEASTISYGAYWRNKLSSAYSMSGVELIESDFAFGTYVGKACANFAAKKKIKADFIASHGHTVFHQPKRGFTYQMGNGNAIHAQTGLPVVYDFRSLDVLNGGQGAPLVPIGDKYLFHEYDVCLNLGGIANLSLEQKKQRIAFDICFANMSLNYLAEKVGEEFDKDGELASQGKIDQTILEKLNTVYNTLNKKRPSLGREFFELKVRPLLQGTKKDIPDMLSTCTESVAMEIVKAIKSYKKTATVLCTGGGTFNSFLMSRMLEHGGDEITFVVPDDNIVKFKEALIFGLLGVLRVRDENNCLKTVTKARKDSSAGILVGF
ncbi:MAG TPA: anhydro-N-acetylmuramic acid kinase [Chryseosolibacter sp.]|nr:anhydro-N-acetylmuramic acid kinase [Chryseosolibacter sp.]